MAGFPRLGGNEEVGCNGKDFEGRLCFDYWVLVIGRDLH